MLGAVTQCSGVVLVHLDRSLTCTALVCEVADAGSPTVVLSHTLFVPCDAVARRGPCLLCAEAPPIDGGLDDR